MKKIIISKFGLKKIYTLYESNEELKDNSYPTVNEEYLDKNKVCAGVILLDSSGCTMQYIYNTDNYAIIEDLGLLDPTNTLFSAPTPSFKDKALLSNELKANYECLFISDEDCPIDGWTPIATDRIKHPERISEYIERGILRLIESK